MRILIDLQGAQTNSRLRGIGRYSLDITKGILRNAGNHEVLVLLNGCIPDQIEGIRSELDGYISQDHILIWDSVSPTDFANPSNRWRQRTSELIREAFICKVNPDVVLLSSFVEGYGEEFTASIGRLNASIPVAVIFYDLIPFLFKREYLSNSWYSKWYSGRITELKKADYFLAISDASRKDAIKHLGVKESNVVNISSAVSDEFVRFDCFSDVGGFMRGLGITRPYLMYTSATDPRKNHLRLLEAYAKLETSVRESHQLVLAGGLPKEHLEKFEMHALKHGLSPGDVICTGKVTDDEMKTLYSECSAFIFPSWYEGFGLPVLEAMQFNKPVIASNRSSIPEIVGIEEALFDPFSVSEMSSKINMVLTDENYRSLLIKNSEKAVKEFSWDKSAKVALQSLEGWIGVRDSKAMGGGDKAVVDNLIDKISQLKLAHNQVDLMHASEVINLHHRVPDKRQLLVDVSVLIERDAKTGIQRVVRNILREWLLNPPQGYSVQPVYASMGQPYRYARQFTRKFLNQVSQKDEVDNIVEFSEGDSFIGLDLLYPHLAIKHAGFYQLMRNHGVNVQFVVYDLLPILLPQHTVAGAPEAHTQWLKIVAQSNGAICISQSVAKELKHWLQKESISTSVHFKVNWFHLGADPEKGSLNPSDTPDSIVSNTLDLLASKPSFLCVGTLEPRKGHLQTLEAFEYLWSQGLDINLVFVGKKGWKVEQLVERVKGHLELNKRLFWFDGISDALLSDIYKSCSCLVAASEGEGFGLPLIEAAHHEIPILARSIPVFGEVAGEHAFYFDGKLPHHLAMAVQNWLKLAAENKQPSSQKMPWLSWAQSARQLEQALHLGESKSTVI